MRILLVLEATLGGTGRYILDLAGGLLDRGHEVHLVYSGLRADYGFHSGLEVLESEPAFHSRSMPMTREVSFSDIACLRRLSSYVRVHGPFDMIHAHSTKAGFLARLVPNRGGARMLYSPHGLMTLNPHLSGLRRSAVAALEATLAHFCDSVVTVSLSEFRCAVKTGIRPEKLIGIPNGLNSAHAPRAERRDLIRTALGLTGDTICIGSVGLLVPNKEPGRLLDAFARLKQQTARPTKLAIVGSGSLEHHLRRQAAQLGLTREILFLGQVNGPDFIPAFDILAHASRYEAFGYVLLEALLAGIPVVTTRVGAAEELITSGVNGYICDPWSVETFASALGLLAENKALRRSMASAARDRAAWFSADRMVDGTVDLYNRILNRAHASPGLPAAAR